MRNFFAGLLLIVICSGASGAIISIDADGFSDGADISSVFAGVTLSSIGGSSGLDGAVYAHGDGLASTGVSVFANNLSFERQWYVDLGGTEGFYLRADFDDAADMVAIDIIGDNPAGTDIGGLYVYDSSGILLGSDISGELSYEQVYTAQISLGSFDIAYILAGGADATGETVHLDNLVANIPEPATVMLLALGMVLSGKRSRKR